MGEERKNRNYGRGTMKKARKEWTYRELQKDFTVIEFTMGIVMVERKKDGVIGAMDYNYHPRVFYNFMAN